MNARSYPYPAAEMRIPAEEYDRIAEEIASAESPVGIDAEKTHVMILHLLRDIQRRVEEIERRLDAATAREPSR